MTPLQLAYVRAKAILIGLILIEPTSSSRNQLYAHRIEIAWMDFLNAHDELFT